MTREQLDIYAVPPGHNDPRETTDDEDLAGGGASRPRRRQPIEPHIARLRRRLTMIGLSVAVFTFGLLEMAQGPTLTPGRATHAAPARPPSLIDKRAPAVAAYQRDWVSQRTGERGGNPLRARSLAVAAYQADWTSQRADERGTYGS